MAFTALVSEKVKNINYQIHRGVRRVRTEVQTGKSISVNKAMNLGARES